MKFVYLLGALLFMAGPILAKDIPPGPDGDLADVPCAYSGGEDSPHHRPTMVSYIGNVQGELTDITVVQLSGDAKQDAAVQDCVRHLRFDPATALGKLNIGRHRLHMGWVTANGETVLRRIGIPHICSQYYPIEALMAHVSGTTTLGFTITAEGRVTNIHVVIPSGDATLDEASLACAQDWRYRPAVKDGQPIAVPWKVEVKWIVPPPPPDAATAPVPLQ